MHTTECGKTAFIHNGGFDGDVDIVSASGATVTVPFDDIREFVAEYVRARRIAAIEDATAADLLDTH
jgi:hypothetical protein